MIVPILFSNVYKGTSYEGEVMLQFHLFDHLKLETSYSYFKFKTEGLKMPGSSTDERFKVPNSVFPMKARRYFSFESIF